jgi:hypothetical protein
MRTASLTFLLLSLVSAATFRGRMSVRGDSASNGKTGSPTTINFVPIVGQSLAIGQAGNPPVSPSQTFNNLKFAGGVIYPSSTATFVALTETSVETIASGFANQVSAFQIADGVTYPQATAIGSWGVSGALYSGLKKGTQPYADSLAGVTSAHTIYPPATAILRVPAILALHGEGDQGVNYTADITEWQSDYQTDIHAVIGGSGTIPMFHTQVTAAFSTTMVEAYENAPTTTILVGPKYFLVYSGTGPHLINTSYRTLGEYYAKAYYKAVVLGQTYSPLRPLTVTRSGAVITLQMAGQVGDLAFDTTAVTNPGNYGFEYWDNAAGGPSATISSVAITDAAAGAVQVTLSGSPTGSQKFLRYAYSGSGRSPTTGIRGCLRDSDTTIGQDGVRLYNWCVHFEKTVP